MKSLQGLPVLVTGGSRGLDLGLVEALVARKAKVTVISGGRGDLDAVADRLGVCILEADVTTPGVAEAVLREVQPSVTILNAGSTQPMGSIHQMSWADSTKVWDQDMRAGLAWMQAAIRAPLPRGSRVLLGWSGAAIAGSSLSDGYAGAKRMIWLLATYGNGVSAEQNLGIRFQALLPQQIIGGTGVGDAEASANAARKALSSQDILATFGKPMDPETYGDFVAALLEDPAADAGTALSSSGNGGIVAMDTEHSI